MTMYDTPTQRPAAKPVAQADALAIWAFVVAWLVPLVGAIMGHVSRGQAKRARMRPSALATWAVALGWAFTAIGATIATVLAVSVGAAVNQAAKAVNTAPAVTAPVYASPVQDTPSVTRDVTRVVFKVTGYAPSGADITYGSDSDNLSPHGGLGTLGNGTAVPWTGSVRYDKNAMYYSVTAQLQGSGDIRCYVIAKVTAYLDNGTHQTESKIMARGHASGSYNICDAQV